MLPEVMYRYPSFYNNNTRTQEYTEVPCIIEDKTDSGLYVIVYMLAADTWFREEVPKERLIFPKFSELIV